MILVPEIETVVILVPRTGSGSLRRAVAERYPKSLLVYRHMEADGIPTGYDRWRRVGVVRNPIDRLWSLYKFLRDFNGQHDPAYVASMRACASRPFSEWMVDNQTVFTSPYDSAGLGRFWPQYTVRHPLPENRKSQFMYIRPDLGTEVFRFSERRDLLAELGLSDQWHSNKTPSEPPPELSEAARNHATRYFAWDFEVA